MQLHQQANNPQLRGYGRFQVLGGINRSLAVQVHKMEQLIFQESANLSIRTATGSYLDQLVIDRLPEGRLPGARAGGYVVFYRNQPSTSDVQIPVGTRVARAVETGDPVLFETIEAATLVAGETAVIVNIRAVEVGIAYNVPTYTITGIYDSLAGIDYVENPLPISGGEDPETDTELRRRYIYAILIPGRATKTMIESHLEDLEGVSEVRVDSIGYGDVEITVDTNEGTHGETATIWQEIRENLAAGVTSRGILAAQVHSSSYETELGDSAGGELWVRPTVVAINTESWSVTYLDHLGRSRTATVTVPALTPKGKGVKMTLEDPDDRVVKVTDVAYSGPYDYDVMIGLGDWPYLYNLPETVYVTVVVYLRLTETAPEGLTDAIEASIASYVGSYEIGRSIEYSDIVFSAIAYDFVNDEVFEGIEEIVSVDITAKNQTIDSFGQKIIFDSDERAESNPPVVEEA